MSGCVFWLVSLWGVDAFCFFSPSRAVFGLSVTAVRRPSEWTAGRVHTLSISPPLRAHVLTCANVCLRGTKPRWEEVCGRCSIHSYCHLALSPVPHMSQYLSEKDESSHSPATGSFIFLIGLWIIFLKNWILHTCFLNIRFALILKHWHGKFYHK